MAGIANGALSFLRLNEAEQLVVDAGIALFEIRKIQRSFLPLKDFGFWDVKVRQNLGNTSDQLQYIKKWYDGQTAYITYNPNRKTGVCVGFCPDDPLWHNRIMLSGVIDSDNFRIDRYHTRDGVLSGAQITDELNIIKNFIHDFKVVDTKTNKLIFRNFSRKPCEEAASAYEEKNGIQDNESDKTIPKRVQIIWTKIERIEKLIALHGGRWFTVEEFQKGIRVEIQDKIKAYYAKNRPDITSVTNNLLSNVAQMTDDERKRLCELLFGEKPVQTQAEQAETPASSQNNFSSMGIDDLRKYARSIDINPDKMKKAEIQNAIREKAAQIALSATNKQPGNDNDGPVTEYPEGDDIQEEEFK